MTSCSLQQQQQHQHPAKFRWTEKLTCRFIQLRRDHAKMFTGRKYSAQQGWEYILRQMHQEFPTVMTDIHYRVLKKKWSNLLQQYKELKNPVHGDKNRADDISWPFYTAIDEVIASLSSSNNNSVSKGSSRNRRRRQRGARCINETDDNNIQPDDEDEDEDEEEEEDEDLNPQEFLYVSVQSSPETPATLGIDYESFLLQQQQQQQQPLETRNSRHTSELLSKLPKATELTVIRPVKRKISRNDNNEEEQENDTTRLLLSSTSKTCKQQKDEGLERRIVEFMEYTRKRDQENSNILMRMLETLEDIRNALR